MTHDFKHMFQFVIACFVVILTLSNTMTANAEETNGVSVRRLGIPVSATDIAEINKLGDSELSQAINEQPIWNAISASDWLLAQSLISQTKIDNPDWKPSPNLAYNLRIGIQNAAITDMVANEDWASILRTTKPSTFCPSATIDWARAQALFHTQNIDDLSNHYISTYTNCENPARKLETLERAIAHLDVNGLTRINDLVSHEERSKELEPVFAKLTHTLLLRRFENLIVQHAWQDAKNLAFENKDPNLLAQIGWHFLETDASIANQAFSRAMLLESNENTAYGQALSASKMGDDSLALERGIMGAKSNSDLSEKWGELAAYAQLRTAQNAFDNAQWSVAIQHANRAMDLSLSSHKNAQALIGASLLGSAQNAYESKNYVLAESLARQAALSGAPSRDASMKIAWSQFHQGKLDQSTDLFKQLYLQSQDEESSEGLFIAASSSEQINQLSSLSDLVGGPLTQKLNGHLSEQAFGRRDFETAYRLSPQSHPELEGLDRIWANQSFAVRSTSGSSGQSKFDAILTRTSLGKSFGNVAFETGLATIAIDSGQAPLNANVGTPNMPNDLGKDSGFSPFIQLVSEGEHKVQASLSTTPLNGPAPARILGELSIERRKQDESIQVKTTLFAQSKDDTLTSLVGRKDPTTGEVYGRVVETGAEIKAAKILDNHATVSIGANVSHLTGHNIADNSHIGGLIAATLPVKLKNFEYVATGPFYGFDSYDKNTNHHTTGHGGYFSPQQHHRLGLSLHAQTLEAHDNLVRINASAAYEMVKTDAASFFPNSDIVGPVYQANSHEGIALSAEIMSMHRINENWSIGTSASVISSDAFNDVRAGLSLRYTPQGRASSVSRDFNSDPLNRDIW